MSAETRARLDEAVKAHVEDEMPGMLSGAWLLLSQVDGVSSLDGDALGGWTFEAEGSLATLLGLTEMWRHEQLARLVEEDR